MENLDYLFEKGLALSEQCLYDDAIECYEKVIELNPESDNAYYNMGLAYYQKSNPEYDNAIMCFEKAIEIEPYKFESYDKCIEIYKSLGLNENAKRIEGLRNIAYHSSLIEKSLETIKVSMKTVCRFI